MKPIELYQKLLTLPITSGIIANSRPNYYHSVESRAALCTQMKVEFLSYLSELVGTDIFNILKPKAENDIKLLTAGGYSNKNLKGVKTSNSWETFAESFVKILVKNGFFSYYNAKEAAKTLFRRTPGFYYGRAGAKIACFSHTSTERLIINDMRVLLNYGAILGGKSRNFVKSKFVAYSGHRFKDSKGLSFVVQNTQQKPVENLDRISITFHHEDYKGNPNIWVLRNIKECLVNVLVKMPHVSDITQVMYDKDVYVEFSIDTSVETPVTTSPAELATPVEVPQVPEPVKSSVTDDDIRAHLQNKIVVLSDEIGVLIQERDSIIESINDRTDRLEKIRKIIEVL